MLKLLYRIPLVRDFVMLFPMAFDFHTPMPRSYFWKAITGFALCYALLGFLSLEALRIFPHLPKGGWAATEPGATTLIDGGTIVLCLFLLACFLPLLAAQVRRLRDAGMSPWWLLLALIPYLGVIPLLIFYLLPSRRPKAGIFGTTQVGTATNRRM